ncbi:helix-turn-helix domain-containing protein [Pontibacter sp. HSC-14F20]|uniref:helix-turn-helix domain-containing protein n=1 Tax=Pontibacter sp. HSC-14F20 TaxID=2864136 RepID=UPI001C730661|nr:helix-turn-helix domain-containing protein [Pontibacter sp. HSC-14F20]MBX0335602.1 helix-turn-helix domain-containing protein [Pontibacter sp. HSC-14F20]
MEKIEIKLSESDKEYLEHYVSKGKHSARAIKRAHVLLQLHGGATLKEASLLSGVSEATVTNVKTRYREEKGDVSKAIEDKPKPGQPPKITQQVEACITSLACSQAPEGRSQWSLRLLAEKVVELGYVESLSHEAVRKCLKKAASSPGRRSSGASGS